MTNSGFSQGIFPRVVTVDKQQVVAITLNQMDSVNSTFIWNEQLHVIVDTLTRRLDSAQVAFKLFHHSDSVMRAEVALKLSAIQERDSLISAQSVVIKSQQKSITKLKLHKALMGIGTGTLAVIIGYLILF